MSNHGLIIGLVKCLNRYGLPSYDWFLHDVVFVMEYGYGIDTGYSACDWIPNQLGLWCPQLYHDTEDLIDQGILYRTYTGELRVQRKEHSYTNFKIPYTILKTSPKKIIDLVFQTYKKLVKNY